MRGSGKTCADALDEFDEHGAKLNEATRRGPGQQIQEVLSSAMLIATIVSLFVTMRRRRGD